MSAAAVELFIARAASEEGDKLKPYDDATGKPVIAPVGNLSWGIGFNLMQCGSHGLFVVMLRYLAAPLDVGLNRYAWYGKSSDSRQSVFIDVAYNEGLTGLIKGFPRMLVYAGQEDWTSCATECKVENESLDKSRYAPLRAIILQG